MLYLSNAHFSTTGKRFCICDSGAFVIVKYLRFLCICDCDTKAKLAPADSATAEEKAFYSKASAQCSMLMLVHMYDCVYINAVMCTCAHVHMHMHMCMHVLSCVHESLCKGNLRQVVKFCTGNLVAICCILV